MIPFGLDSADGALAAVPAAATTTRNAACSKSRRPGAARPCQRYRAVKRPRAWRSSCHGVRIRGAVAGDRDRELEVGGQRAVLGVDRPVVVAHPHGVAAGRDHRLDGQDHALLEQRALAGLAEVGDLRVLVHVAADAVADERAHDREAVGLDLLLDGVGDVAEAVAGPALLDGGEQRALGRREQLGRRPGEIGPTGKVRAASATQPSSTTPTSMERMSPARELVGPGDPVHDHRVGRGADRAREAAVALEGGLGALGADELLRRGVELGGGHAGAHLPSSSARVRTRISPAAAILSISSGDFLMIIGGVTAGPRGAAWRGSRGCGRGPPWACARRRSGAAALAPRSSRSAARSARGRPRAGA